MHEGPAVPHKVSSVSLKLAQQAWLPRQMDFCACQQEPGPCHGAGPTPGLLRGTETHVPTRVHTCLPRSDASFSRPTEARGQQSQRKRSSSEGPTLEAWKGKAQTRVLTQEDTRWPHPCTAGRLTITNDLYLPIN